MVGDIAVQASVETGGKALLSWTKRHWFLLLALAALIIPSLITMITLGWSSEQGASGPIILASGLWLLLREIRSLDVEPQAPSRWSGLWLIPVLAGYSVGRLFGTVWLEWMCAYAALLWVAYAHLGGQILSRLWFPLCYFLFLPPPPYRLVAAIAYARKLWLSQTSVNILSALGYDTAYSGTTLYIDQYELVIANACAGMNALTSLVAIILFYVYVVHAAHWRYAALLALLSVPVAMLANLIRIISLLLITHYAGVAFSDGVSHKIVGIMMFVLALVIMIGVDAMLSPFRQRLDHWK